jgi:hypothetical protein
VYTTGQRLWSDGTEDKQHDGTTEKLHQFSPPAKHGKQREKRSKSMSQLIVPRDRFHALRNHVFATRWGLTIMKSAFALSEIASAFLGTIFGVVNWYLTEFYLARVVWEGPLLLVNRAAWLFNVLGLGAGAILIALAVLQPPDER